MVFSISFLVVNSVGNPKLPRFLRNSCLSLLLFLHSTSNRLLLQRVCQVACANSSARPEAVLCNAIGSIMFFHDLQIGLTFCKMILLARSVLSRFSVTITTTGLFLLLSPSWSRLTVSTGDHRLACQNQLA